MVIAGYLITARYGYRYRHRTSTIESRAAVKGKGHCQRSEGGTGRCMQARAHLISITTILSFQQLHSLLSCLCHLATFSLTIPSSLPEPSGPSQGFDLPKLQPLVGPLKDNTANPYYTFPVSPCASLPCILLLRLQTESETRLHIALRRFGHRTVHHTSKDEGVAICVQHAWR